MTVLAHALTGHNKLSSVRNTTCAVLFLLLFFSKFKRDGNYRSAYNKREELWSKEEPFFYHMFFNLTTFVLLLSSLWEHLRFKHDLVVKHFAPIHKWLSATSLYVVSDNSIIFLRFINGRAFYFLLLLSMKSWHHGPVAIIVWKWQNKDNRVQIGHCFHVWCLYNNS